MNTQESTEQYINKLAKYGPSLNNNNSFAESQTGDNFQFIVECCENYIETMTDVIKQDRPAIIVVNGQAGDGKTHLILNLLQSRFGINLQFSLNDSTYREITEFNSLEPNRKCPVWLVSDCSELADQSPEKELLLNDMMGILLDDSATDHKVNKIIILAANKGILLQHFEEMSLNIVSDDVRKEFSQKYLLTLRSYFLGDSNTCFSEGALCALNVRSNKLVKAASEKLFLMDMSSIVDEKLIYEIVSELFDEKHFSDCSSCSLRNSCPIHRNYEVLNADNQRFKYGLASIIMLLIANGAHLNIRKLLIILANALLGRWDENAPLITCKEIKSLPVDKKIIQEYNYFKYETECLNGGYGSNDYVVHSNPYDNLFGLNLIAFDDSENNDDSGISNVFKQLMSTGIGTRSSIPIDTFLTNCKKDDVQDSNSFFFPVAKYFITDDSFKRTYKDHAFDSFKAALASIRRDFDERKNSNVSNRKTDGHHHLDQLNILESLRRCFFFTMHDDNTVTGSRERMDACKKLLDDLYNLSSFKHGIEFLTLWHKVISLKPYLDNTNTNTNPGIKKYCNELSKLLKKNYFTSPWYKNVTFGLKAVFSDCYDADSNAQQINIHFNSTTNEINESRMLSEEFVLSLSENSYAPGYASWAIVPNQSILQLPMVEAGDPVVSLTLTPDIYEALSALGKGALSINYSPQCLAAIEIFREKLSAQIIQVQCNNIELYEVLPSLK